MNTLTNKTPCLLSLLVVGYFVLLLINGYLTRIDLPFLGAIQELITLPALLLQVALLVVAAKRLNKTGLLRDGYLLTAFSFLCVSALGTVGSLTLAFLGYGA